MNPQLPAQQILLPCRVNGSEGVIVVDRSAWVDAARFQMGALSAREAAAFLGISTATLWRRTNLPKRDGRRIERTSYGTYPVEALRKHLAAEMVYES